MLVLWHGRSILSHCCCWSVTRKHWLQSLFMVGTTCILWLCSAPKFSTGDAWPAYLTHWCLQSIPFKQNWTVKIWFLLHFKPMQASAMTRGSSDFGAISVRYNGDNRIIPNLVYLFTYGYSSNPLDWPLENPRWRPFFKMAAIFAFFDIIFGYNSPIWVILVSVYTFWSMQNPNLLFKTNSDRYICQDSGHLSRWRPFWADKSLFLTSILI